MGHVRLYIFRQIATWGGTGNVIVYLLNVQNKKGRFFLKFVEMFFLIHFVSTALLRTFRHISNSKYSPEGIEIGKIDDNNWSLQLYIYTCSCLEYN